MDETRQVEITESGTLSTHLFITPVQHTPYTTHLFDTQQYRIRYSKLVAKKMLKAVSADFRSWMHEDPDTVKHKLTLFREFCSEDAADAADMAKIYSFVVQALVDFAIGGPSATSVKPYGLPAARSERAFKALPTTVLAVTVSSLYQVVRTEPANLDAWIKKPRPNITSPWRRGTIARFVHMRKVFKQYRTKAFKSYEENDGLYMGEPELSAAVSKQTVSDIEFDEDF